MAVDTSSTKAFELPKLKKILKTDLENPDSEANQFWDAKFYPFDNRPEAPAIFAILNNNNILVCRVSATPNTEIEMLKVLSVNEGDQFRSKFCAGTWAFVTPDRPLLLGAGDAGVIRVFDVVSGELKTSLLGHGVGVINDLATHPKYPWIVASASHDTSVRIWDLRRLDNKYESPCVVICGHGSGHRESVLTVSWHGCGRYIATGAHDHRVCVWTLPDLSPESSFWEEISASQRKRSSDEVRIIYYPHFITSAVHTNFVDCVRFWGDLIISKASGQEAKIVLWSITGFNSHTSPPDAILAPKTEEHLDTRNGFMHTHTIDGRGVHKTEIPEIYETKLPYTRLLEFDVKHIDPFFLRFDLLKPTPTHPDLHPTLAIGNTKSQVFFFDLLALELGYNPLATSPIKRKQAPKKGLAIPIDRSTTTTTSRSDSTTPSLSRSSSLQHPSTSLPISDGPTNPGTRPPHLPPAQPPHPPPPNIYLQSHRFSPAILPHARRGMESRWTLVCFCGGDEREEFQWETARAR